MSEKRASFAPGQITQRRLDGTKKVRRVMMPDEETKQRHRSMLKFLYSLGNHMPYAMGSVPGTQLLDNVLPHRQSNSFYKLDIQDAFPSVDKAELKRVITGPVIPRRFQPRVLEFVENWATHPDIPGLPQGAPASPFLFNLYCLPLDQQLGRYCGQRKTTYTRYIDDLTFSAARPLDRHRRRDIRTMIESHPGMTINNGKSQVHSLEKGPVTITGVSLYPDRRLGASPLLLETARLAFEGAARDAEAGYLFSEYSAEQLHGYHGALHQLTDGETPTLRRLDRAYYEALGKWGIEG